MVIAWRNGRGAGSWRWRGYPLQPGRARHRRGSGCARARGLGGMRSGGRAGCWRRGCAEDGGTLFAGDARCQEERSLEYVTGPELRIVVVEAAGSTSKKSSGIKPHFGLSSTITVLGAGCVMQAARELRCRQRRRIMETLWEAGASAVATKMNQEITIELRARQCSAAAYKHG